MANQTLPDSDHVSRYCKPSAVDEHGLPMSAAFLPRQTEDYLSVNWLEYLSAANLSAAVDRVQEIFRRKGFRVRPSGRFSVLQVGAAQSATFETSQSDLSITHMPISDDQSHAGIFGFTSEDLAVAAALAALVTPEDVHTVAT